MDLPLVQKENVIQYVLFNKNSKEYVDTEGYTVTELLKAEKYDDYKIAVSVIDIMDEPDIWRIAKIETTCEIKEIF